MPALQVSALQGCPQYSTQSPVDITRNVTLTCNFLFTATHNFNSRGGEGSKNKRWDLDYAKLTWKVLYQRLKQTMNYHTRRYTMSVICDHEPLL